MVKETDVNEARQKQSVVLKVPSARTGRVSGSKVTFYTVESYRLGGNQERGTVEHRFNDFSELNKRLTARFGKQVPGFLVSRNKLFQDHFSDSFIEDRRLLLEDWLRRCAAAPALRDSAELIAFLDLRTDAKLYESNVVFGSPADLPSTVAARTANTDSKTVVSPAPAAPVAAPSLANKFATAIGRGGNKKAASGITDDDL